MKKVSLLIVMVLSLFLSCEKEKEEEVQIRIENTSSHTYKEILVTLDTEHDYGTLAPGKKSAYQTFTRAYRYASIKFKIERTTYVLQPFDYVGEEELKPGKYTYQLSASAPGGDYGSIDLTLKED